MKYIVELNGKKYEVEVKEGEARILSQSEAAPVQSTPAPTAAPRSAVNIGSGTPVKSPMPGTVIALSVSDGQSVKAGDTILVLEAMKMENDITASADGTVKFTVTKNSAVDTGTVLAVIS